MELAPILAAAFGATALWLAFTLRREARVRAAARAGYFAQAASLFDRTSVKLQPTGFARMTGWRGDEAFDLQSIPDSLSWRKLPALWLMVSLPRALPVRATLDIMTRATGAEPFSHYARLPQVVPCPDFLPEGTGLRSDDVTGLPDQALVARHAGIFADQRVKELLISPRGLRLVILAEEADRSRYLLFRDAEMGRVPIAAARVGRLVAALEALRDDLVREDGA